MTQREAALKLAISYIGKEEVPRGSNSGPFVKECLATVGIKFPAAWCQAMAYRCYSEGAKEAGVACTAIKTAGVLDNWNKTDASMKLLPHEFLAHPELILPGYQMILKEGDTTGHTGIIERVVINEAHPEQSMAYVIEGNTNDNGSREGYGVFRKLRKLSGMHGIIKHD